MKLILNESYSLAENQLKAIFNGCVYERNQMCQYFSNDMTMKHQDLRRDEGQIKIPNFHLITYACFV